MFPHDSPIFPLFPIECSPQGTEGDGKLSFDFTIDKTIPRKVSLIFPYPSSSFSSSLFFFIFLILLLFFFVRISTLSRFFDSLRINRVRSILMIFDYSMDYSIIQLDEKGNFLVR